MAVNSGNIRKDKQLYVFVLDYSSCFFAKGKASQDMGSYVKIDEIYIGGGVRFNYKVGENVHFKYSSLYVNFSTPLQKVVKYNLGKYVIESIFNEGEHKSFSYGNYNMGYSDYSDKNNWERFQGKKRRR
jgi:hypothetical protein